MTSFSISTDILTRLSRLHLACDAESTTPLRHIQIRVTPDDVRFAATNGRILAVIRTDIDNFQGDPRDAILDVHQLSDAIKAVDRAIPNRGNHRVTITISDTEARFSALTAAALVRLHPGTYPRFDHVFSRTVGQRWVPSLSSLNPDLIAVAQKLAGKTPVLFSSPTTSGALLPRLWGMGAADDHAVTIPLTDMRSLVTAPAYWADHQLAILAMPISRADSERQFDFSGFIRHTPASSTSAA